jgi:integrase
VNRPHTQLQGVDQALVDATRCVNSHHLFPLTEGVPIHRIGGTVDRQLRLSTGRPQAEAVAACPGWWGPCWRHTASGTHDLGRFDVPQLAASEVDLPALMHHMGHKTAKLAPEVYARADTVAVRAQAGTIWTHVLTAMSHIECTEPAGPESASRK